jgi:hypothetical protein
VGGLVKLAFNISILSSCVLILLSTVNTITTEEA